MLPLSTKRLNSSVANIWRKFIPAICLLKVIVSSVRYLSSLPMLNFCGKGLSTNVLESSSLSIRITNASLQTSDARYAIPKPISGGYSRITMSKYWTRVLSVKPVASLTVRILYLKFRVGSTSKALQ
jgi:hypothetical protein